MLYGELNTETTKQEKSGCRNSAIAEAIHYIYIIEAWGVGIPRIINRYKEYGLKEPFFEEFDAKLKVTMFRKVKVAIGDGKLAINPLNFVIEDKKVAIDELKEKINLLSRNNRQKKR